MNKRGQFYLITVLIISIALFTLISTTNTITEPILFEDFSTLTNNYMTESKYVINSALFYKLNISERLDKYTREFITESKKKNPNIGLIYIYSNGSKAEVRNFLSSSITNYQGVSTLGAYEAVLQNVEVYIGGTKFVHQVPVKAQDFGETWYTTSSPSANPINISIGGIVHNFQLSNDKPELKVILRTYSNQYEHIIGGNSSLESGILFSPSSDKAYIAVQQEVNK